MSLFERRKDYQKLLNTVPVGSFGIIGERGIVSTSSLALPIFIVILEKGTLL